MGTVYTNAAWAIKFQENPTKERKHTDNECKHESPYRELRVPDFDGDDTEREH
jgi:hypothetical protein